MGKEQNVRVSSHSSTHVKSGAQLAGWEISNAQHTQRAIKIDKDEEDRVNQQNDRRSKRKAKLA